MLVIGNDALGEEVDNFIICDICFKKHKIKYGVKILPDGLKISSKLIGYVRCKGKSYLVTIDGHKI